MPLVFVVAVIVSFFIQKPFARMARYFYSTFTHNKLYFMGKYFRLIPSDAFILSFGIFCVVFTALIFGHRLKPGLYRAGLVVALFFVSVALICWFNAVMYLAECTACNDGRRAMSARDLKYDNLFIAGLVAALLPMLTEAVVQWVVKKDKAPGANYKISAQR